MIWLGLILSAMFLAYANGANDNFKGVATLYGSGVATYRQALALTTLATLAGSGVSLWLAADLVKAFSGKGLVPDALAASPPFLLSVALGASLTVIAATRLALPVSTTHALLGAMVGAGWMAVGADLNPAVLTKGFALPLLTSPLIALALSLAANLAWHRWSRARASRAEDCLCITTEPVIAPFQVRVGDAGSGGASMRATALGVRLAVVGGRGDSCAQPLGGQTATRTPPRHVLHRFTARSGLTFWHGLSATALCFARGLNDTPKIVGLMVALQALNVRVSMVMVALAMAAGGVFHARRVAETLSHKITPMSEGAACVSNTVTSTIVVAASLLGLPVSTTHVGVGAISGMGLVSRSIDTRALRSILASWILTLPLAASAASVVWLVVASTI